jgi:hypothetical protein
MLKERHNLGWMMVAWIAVALLLAGIIWLGANVVQFVPAA